MDTLFFDAFVCVGPRANKHPAHPWRLDQVVADMEHCSIAGALVASQLSVTYDPMLGNRRLSRELAGRPNLFPIWNAMPHHTREFPAPAELIGLLRQHDVRAVTLYPKTNCWDVLSASSSDLLSALQDHGILTLIKKDEFGAFGELETLLARYPRLPVLLVGAKWSDQRFVVPLLQRHPLLHLTFTHYQTHHGLEWLVEMGCEDQLVYGSHAPEMAMGAHRAYVDYAALPEATRANIAGGNLRRLLRGQGPDQARVNPAEDRFMRRARLGQPQEDLVLDMHVHVLNEGLNGAGGNCAMYRGGPAGCHELMKRLGYRGAGLMSWEVASGDSAGGNRTVQEALDIFPDTFWGLGSFDPCHYSQDEMKRQIEALYADPRFIGMKPYTVYGLRYDDPLYAVWWEFGNAHGLYALMHPSGSDLNDIDSLAGRYPNITWVIPHCGGSYQAADKAIACLQKHHNAFAEITLTPVTNGVIEYLTERVGVDRVLFGSDLPMRDPRQQLGWVVYSRLAEEDKAKVLGLNAERIIRPIRERRRLLASGRLQKARKTRASAV